MATSKIILFFGKSLQARTQKADQDGALDGLSNEFTIKNLNDYPLRYQLVTYSLTGASTESTNSRSVFNFTQAMYDSPLCKNRTDTGRMTKLIVDLNGDQEMTVKLRFEPSTNAVIGAPHHNGCLRISAIGYSERFKVTLVGFINRFVQT